MSAVSPRSASPRRPARRALALLALTACAVWGGPAPAQKALPNLAPLYSSEPEFTELWKRFDRYCLQAFPDDDAVAAGARDEGGKPLTAPQAKAILHEDVASAWTIDARYGIYILTLAAPPAHACAVRKLFRVSPKFQPLLPGLVGAWAGGLDPPLPVTALPMTETKTTPPQTAYRYELRGPNGRVVETIGAVLVPIADSTQAELRLARTRGSDRK
jgi:hypothetical protein